MSICIGIGVVGILNTDGEYCTRVFVVLGEGEVGEELKASGIYSSLGVPMVDVVEETESL